ncbi:MAG: TonB-dependent receptor [Chitinophagaceae bacterium]|nr:MAG: TonB-dependent receptor [Chitinophagaceae bacterium]
MPFKRGKPLLILIFVYCLPLFALAQTVVTGKVTDSTGAGLPNVSVLLKGSQSGTNTGTDGKFSLNIQRKGNEILVFSIVGYTSKEVPVGNEIAFNVQLEAENKVLENVIVVGYGAQRKKDITGAISSISEKSLREVPVTNAPQMLQGRAAGVYVVNQGNKPGAGVQVRVRGRRSFNAGNDPLYVVDGIPITGGFNDINPNDIESMDVLKDASATAIYGSRGANGVVIVTTKRGKSGGTTVNYSTYLGVSKIFKFADIFDGPEFAEYKRESRRAVGLYNDSDPEADQKLFEEVELQSIAAGRTTDYQRMMVENGFIQNHDLSILGGTDKTRYNISFNYFNDKGIIPGQDFTRYTTRVNIDQGIGKRFKVGLSTLGSYSVRNGEDVNPYGNALIENPLGVPYDESGNLIFLPTSDGLRSNPLSDIVPGAVINQGKRFRLLSSFYGEAEIVDGLKFRMNFGPDLVQNRKGNFRGRFSNERRLGDPSANTNEDFVLLYTWENILTYRKTFAEKHNLDLTGLYSVQTRNFESSNAGVTGLPVESLEYYNLGQTGNPLANTLGSNYQKWTILSYMGRVNYGFDSRFLVTFTVRADGSSKFAPGNKWGIFPSGAVAWNITEENFMKSARVFSNLKLRATYGTTGNEGIDPYQTPGLLARTSYDFDGSPAFGFRPNTIPNQGLKWETTTSGNIGLDFGILNDRITGAVEVYQARTTDLLLPQLLPISSGFGSILTNVGSTKNTGIEVTISSQNIVPKKDGAFSWTTDLNFFSNKEEIVELSQGKVDDVGSARFIGEPQRVFFDYEKIGIWQTKDAALAQSYNSKVGQIRVADRNNNGVIDPEDRTILGTDIPSLTGGITNRFEYKNFDLSVVVFARFGNMIQSPMHNGSINNLFGRYNNFDVDYWTANNPTDAYPQPNTNQEFPIYGSTLQYFDGSFVKVRSINLGYNFRESVAKSIRAKMLRVYVTAQDPFMWSPYVSKHNGIDPEIDPAANPPGATTPLSRKFLVGINVSF